MPQQKSSYSMSSFGRILACRSKLSTIPKNPLGKCPLGTHLYTHFPLSPLIPLVVAAGVPQPQPPAGCASGHNFRRRTDLMPTIPSRDPAATSQPRKPFTRSPGRAYSMSRLDQLARPRKRPQAELPAVHEASRPLSRQSQRSSVSRSMSHLAVGKGQLRKSDSRSMHQLSGSTAPVPPPRTTRAAQLRQQKLAAASNGTSDGMSGGEERRS